MNTVWTYWEDRPGEATPPHILLCREALRHQCKECELRLVTPANVHQYLPDLNPRIWRISLQNQDQNPIAVRCAFIRAFLLERYGGLYVDADCIALKDFVEAFRASAGHEFFAMRRTSAKTNHISIGFYGSQANGQVITSYAEALRQILNEKTLFKWAEVGAHLLTPIADRHFDRVFLFPEQQIHPIVAENQQHLAENNASPDKYISEDAYCLMLFHRIFETPVKGVSLATASVHDLYHGGTLISKVFRHALPKKVFHRSFGREKESVTTREHDDTPLIATRYESDKLIERIGFCILDAEPVAEIHKISNSSIRIAAVLEERLYQGLRFDAEIELLTPANWQKVLKYTKPDILLMESFWTTATGHWYMGQFTPSKFHNTLLSLVSLARSHDIPTVFWHTKGHVYHEQYKHFARHFDFVFCADPREAEQLRKEGVNAEVLLPCAQPAWIPDNPADKQTIPILYDGWSDLDRMEDKLSALLALRDKGLNIIESRYRIFRKRKQALPNYSSCIRGCTSFRTRQYLLQTTDCYVTFESTLSTPTTQQWLTLEAAAYAVPCIHLGELTSQDPRAGIVESYTQTSEFISCIKRYSSARKSAKTVVQDTKEHNAAQVATYEQRLNQIYQRITASDRVSSRPIHKD